MNWDAINTVVQSISMLLVSITLFFTYRQLKEASRQSRNLDITLRTSVAQSVTQGQRDMWEILFNDEEMLKWYLESRCIPTEVSHLNNKKKGFAALKMDFYEALYLQYKQENVDNETWRAWYQAMRLDLKDKFFQQVWNCMNKNQLYAPSFVKSVENILSDQKYVDI
jgi:hypothetical protein